jgi:integrase
MNLPDRPALDNLGGDGRNGPMLKVAHIVESFLSHQEVKVKCDQAEPGTFAFYKNQMRKLLAAVGEFPAAELRAHHLVSVEFTYHFVRALKALYRWASDEDVELIPKDPFRKLKIPPCGERNRVLTREEMRALYLAAGRPFRRFLFVQSRTIARPGEIRGLTWGQINWDRRLILLKKFKGKRRRRDGMKLRPIPLDRPTFRMLRNLWRNAGSPGADVSVWLGRDGKPWSANAIRCQMRRVRTRAGLDPAGVERVVCYTLRHTGATDATRQGIPIQTIARIMGHTRTSTTDRYQHLAGDDLVDAIDLKAARSKRAGT